MWARIESVPIARFRTFEQAEAALWHRPGDPRALRVAASLLAFAVKQGLVSPIKGVRRYRTLEEADQSSTGSVAGRGVLEA